MTQRLLNDIHTRLAAERFWALWNDGKRGDVALQAFAETAETARAQYRAVPWWRRW